MRVEPRNARAAIDSGACAAGKAAVGLAGVAAGGGKALGARELADVARHALRSQHALSFGPLRKDCSRPKPWARNLGAETLGLF